MPFSRWDPFRVIEALSEQRRQAVARADRDDRSAPVGPSPSVAMRESADEFLITVALASVRDADVTMDIVDGELHLHLRKRAAPPPHPLAPCSVRMPA